MAALARIGGAIGAAGQAAFGALLDFALPPRCPGCGAIVAGDHRFCLGCWQSLDFLGGPACARCGDPFEHDLGPDACCDPCRAAPPATDGVAAAVAYGPIARQLALKLKYGGRLGVAETMARAMARLLPADAADMMIVPVPLHRGRLWRRGFNQAALIGRALARHGGGRLEVRLLRRPGRTPLLRGLGRAARERAVRDAFAIDPAHVAQLAGMRVLLIDDVYTTGATAQACARVLKRGGAAEVRLLCWARVVRRRGTDAAAER